MKGISNKIKGVWKNHRKIFLGGIWLIIIVPAAMVIILSFGEVSAIKGKPELLRGIGLFLLGIGVAPLGLLLAYNRTESLKLQTETEKEKAVTEAFAKSVELLGNEREAARQGGIYALGRLAGDNPTLHPMIMDIVSSYIRQESRSRFAKEKNKREKKANKSIDKDELIDKLRLEPMPMDIEAAIAVIRERKVEQDKIPGEGEELLDLSNAFIFNADFSNTRLTRVNFSDSVMINCVFDKTDLSGSNFVASNLKGSSVTQEQVDSMEDINEQTVFPEGLLPRKNDDNSAQE